MIKVTFNLDTSSFPPHSQEELDAWLAYELGATGSISMRNPLATEELEAAFGSIEVD